MLDVLIPYFGDPALMRVATLSVLEQTCPPNRVIIVDDCDPDPSVGLWAESLRDERVTYLRNAHNLGANGNYRYSLQQSEADYVVLMGADDVMSPRFVERSVEMIEQFRGPDIIQCGVQVIDAAGRPHMPLVDRVKLRMKPRGSPATVISGERAAVSLLHGNWTYFPSLVWKRSAILDVGWRGFDVVQDLALLIDVLRAGGKLVVDDEITFQYRRHAASDSGVETASGKRFREECEYFRAVSDELASEGWRRASRAARLHVTSRLHAAALLPQAIAKRQWPIAGSHARHLLS